MNVYINEKAQNDAPSIILGVFTTLEGAQHWKTSTDNMGDVESARYDMAEYDTNDNVDAYWSDG